MPAPRAEFLRGGVRWLVPAALLALTPKCFLCVLAYAGLGAALGLTGPEMCGGSVGSPASRLTWLVLPGLALAGTFFISKRKGGL